FSRPHVQLPADPPHPRRPDPHDGGVAAGGPGRGTGVARRWRRYRAVHGRPAGDDLAHQDHLVVRRYLPVHLPRPRLHVGAQRGAALGARGRRSRAGPRPAHAAAAPREPGAAEHTAATLQPESTAPSLTVTQPTCCSKTELGSPAPRRCRSSPRRLGDGQRWGGGLWLEGCGGVFCGAGLAGSGSGVGWTGAGAGAPPSSTERGAALCADMKARTREMNKKIPAHHQVILVSKVVAGRPPMNCSVPAPPPSDASPPPWPACSNTAVVRIRASRVRRISRKLYMRPGKYLGSAGLHKLRPAFGIERGAAHQDAIELAFG